MNIPTVLKLTTSWSPCEAPRASARDQRAGDQRDIISHGSQSQAGASSLQSIKGSSLSSSFDWWYAQKPEQQITKAHIWSKQWSICHGCFPHFLPLVKRKRSGSEREMEARPQTDLSSENKSTDGGRSRIPTTWARVSIEPLLLLFVTMWAWWWWPGISSLLAGGHKPPSWVRIWERVGLERRGGDHYMEVRPWLGSRVWGWRVNWSKIIKYGKLRSGSQEFGWHAVRLVVWVF